MKFIVIGLGCFGQGLAQALSDFGHEVIGVDSNEKRIDAMKNKISGAFILDATDNQSLSVLPLNDVDAIIVAVGRDLGASIKIVSLLINHRITIPIYARSFDDIHTSVLSALGIKHILHPEMEAAQMYAGRFSNNHIGF